MAKSRRRDEDQLQIGVCDLLRLNGYWPVHAPNQGQRSIVGHAVLKRMGLEPGFPDLMVFDRKSAGGKLLFLIELKRPPRPLKRGGCAKPLQPGRVQIDMHQELAERGYPVIVAHSIDEVIAGAARLGIVITARVMA